MERNPPSLNQIRMLDEMYRSECDIYGLAREYYLMGTDRLILSVDLKPGERLLDWGCGAGRVLLQLARRFPKSQFYGVESSSDLVARAITAIDRREAAARITICQSHLSDVDPRRTLDLPREAGGTWDAICFNYSLSGLPHWKVALAVAIDQLRPGKSLYVCDFSDHAELPGKFRRSLAPWLERFDIRPNKEILAHLEEQALNGAGSLAVRHVAHRFAYVARLVKSGDPAHPMTATADVNALAADESPTGD